MIRPLYTDGVMEVLQHRQTVDVIGFQAVRGVTVSLGRRRLRFLLLDLLDVTASCIMSKALTGFVLSSKGRTQSVMAAGFTAHLSIPHRLITRLEFIQLHRVQGTRTQVLQNIRMSPPNVDSVHTLHRTRVVGS